MNQLHIPPPVCVCVSVCVFVFIFCDSHIYLVPAELFQLSEAHFAVCDKSSNYVMFMRIKLHQTKLTSCKCFVARFNASSWPDCLSSLRLS